MKLQIVVTSVFNVRHMLCVQPFVQLFYEMGVEFHVK